MSSWLRVVVMWLLVAALPVQSWAAATMIHCGPSHHRMATEAVAAQHTAHDASQEAGPHTDHHADHHADHPAAHAHAGHSHDHAAMAMAQVADVDVDSDAGSTSQADTEPLQELGKFKCSACASCCLGMALPSTILSFDAGVSSDTVEPGMRESVVAFLTGGPERPPRTSRA